MEALECGRCVIGRRLLQSINQHLKLMEADGAVFNMDFPLAILMKRLGESERGMKKKQEDQYM